MAIPNLDPARLPARVFLQLRAREGSSPYTAYALHAAVAPICRTAACGSGIPSELEPNDTGPTGPELAAEATLTGLIDGPSDRDVFGLTAPPDRMLRVLLASPPGLRLALSVVPADRSPTRLEAARPGEPLGLSDLAVPPGPILLEVRAVGGGFDPRRTYRLEVALGPAPPALPMAASEALDAEPGLPPSPPP
jgi:hypothetical protein